jgi:FAD/FMN-containing dehydrogenase/Pyruvate/2-oxoacid:ferredoxin oxidoreductase delta subunit
MILDTPHEVKLYARETIELPGILTSLLVKIHSVYQPKDIQELQEMISEAKKNRMRIIPRGAATSGMGGLTPLKKSIIMDLTQLNRIHDFDEKKKTVCFEAGLRWWSLKQFLSKHSFSLYTYPTSLFSTVGGWLSTGGYGINSFRYGHISNLVESIEILASGKCKTINRNDQEFRYFIGTEGQMGIISKVRLKIRELRPTKSYLVFFGTPSDAVSFIDDLTKSSAVRPVHVAYFDRQRLELKNSFLDGNISFPAREGVLVAFDRHSSAAGFLDSAERKGGTLAQDHLTAFLWNERFFPFSIRRFYPSVLGCETVLPVRNLPQYIGHTRQFGKSYGLPLSTEATLINKNMAVAFTIFPSNPHNFSHFFHLFLSYSLANVASMCGGTPYGIGVWNLPLLKKVFSKEDYKQYKLFKKESDPSCLYNPGKAFSSDLNIKSLLKLAYSMSALFSDGNLLSQALSKVLNGRSKKSHRDLSEPEACANCGACTAVCPAYLINKTEAVTAKGKLFLFKDLLNGARLPGQLREQMFLCLHCHLCEYVCQSKLKLNPVWDRLESILEKEFGRPEEKIAEFVKRAESDPAYSELLDSLNLPPNANSENSLNV